MLYFRGYKAGLTLFEMLVALTIIIILTVLALPSFLGFNQQHRAAMMGQSLYYFLQDARSEAVKQNQTVYVNFQTGDSWCYGMNIGSNCNCNIASNCSAGVVSAPRAQDMTLSATGLTNSSLSFEGTRGAAGTKSTLTYTIYGGTQAMSVQVSVLGNIQMCSSDFSGYSACS